MELHNICVELRVSTPQKYQTQGEEKVRKKEKKEREEVEEREKKSMQQ